MLQDPTGAPLVLSGLINGTYVSYTVDPNGQINGVDAAGVTTNIGTVGMATFANPGGLLKVGNTEFQSTASSGVAQTGAANTGGRGSLTSGYIEMSNVNLAQELTNLIISQRGFQANSKVVTTSDEILQTLVNLKQ
jgi:flagellar hook protein FlgE